jgi:hypothetical protein
MSFRTIRTTRFVPFTSIKNRNGIGLLVFMYCCETVCARRVQVNPPKRIIRNRTCALLQQCAVLEPNLITSHIGRGWSQDVVRRGWYSLQVQMHASIFIKVIIIFNIRCYICNNVYAVLYHVIVLATAEKPCEIQLPWPQSPAPSTLYEICVPPKILLP